MIKFRSWINPNVTVCLDDDKKKEEEEEEEEEEVRNNLLKTICKIQLENFLIWAFFFFFFFFECQFWQFFIRSIFLNTLEKFRKLKVWSEAVDTSKFGDQFWAEYL